MANVVLDIGSCWTKAGFSGMEEPILKLQSRPSKQGPLHGDEILGQIDQHGGWRRARDTLIEPLDLESIIDRIYEEIDVSPSEAPILLTETPLASKNRRLELAQLLFEKHETPGLSLFCSASASLYANGILTGCVLDCGHETTYAMPICDGFEIREAVTSCSVAGQTVTKLLQGMLEEQGYWFRDPQQASIVSTIKESLAYIPLNFKREITELPFRRSTIERSFKLPDGQTITLSSERFRCAEILFDPSLTGNTMSVGVHETAYRSIIRADVHMRRSLYQNIVVAGGTTLIEGFTRRLQREIKARAPAGVTIEVVGSEDRQYAAWIGAAIFASLSTFDSTLVLKADYEDRGISAIDRIFPPYVAQELDMGFNKLASGAMLADAEFEFSKSEKKQSKEKEINKEDGVNESWEDRAIKAEKLLQEALKDMEVLKSQMQNETKESNHTETGKSSSGTRHDRQSSNRPGHRKRQLTVTFSADGIASVTGDTGEAESNEAESNEIKSNDTESNVAKKDESNDLHVQPPVDLSSPEWLAKTEPVTGTPYFANSTSGQIVFVPCKSEELCLRLLIEPNGCVIPFKDSTNTNNPNAPPSHQLHNRLAERRMRSRTIVESSGLEVTRGKSSESPDKLEQWEERRDPISGQLFFVNKSKHKAVSRFPGWGMRRTSTARRASGVAFEASLSSARERSHALGLIAENKQTTSSKQIEKSKGNRNQRSKTVINSGDLLWVVDHILNRHLSDEEDDLGSSSDKFAKTSPSHLVASSNESMADEPKEQKLVETIISSTDSKDKHTPEKKERTKSKRVQFPQSSQDMTLSLPSHYHDSCHSGSDIISTTPTSNTPMDSVSKANASAKTEKTLSDGLKSPISSGKATLKLQQLSQESTKQLTPYIADAQSTSKLDLLEQEKRRVLIRNALDTELSEFVGKDTNVEYWKQYFDTVCLNDELDWIKNKLLEGIEVVKHGHKGSPHRRILFCDASFKKICWQSVRAVTRNIRLNSGIETEFITEILAGQSTAVFERSGDPKKATRCLSIITHSRTLDIELDSQQLRDRLVRGFELLAASVLPANRASATFIPTSISFNAFPSTSTSTPASNKQLGSFQFKKQESIQRLRQDTNQDGTSTQSLQKNPAEHPISPSRASLRKQKEKDLLQAAHRAANLGVDLGSENEEALASHPIYSKRLESVGKAIQKRSSLASLDGNRVNSVTTVNDSLPKESSDSNDQSIISRSDSIQPGHFTN